MTATTMNRRRYPGNEPSRRLTGWAVVVLLHILIFWALVSGTARKGLEIIKKPLEAAVIQEVIIPPPPPPPPPPPKEIVKRVEPKVKTEVPPPFVPPPEVTPPVSAAPAIAAVATPPPTPAVIAPPPPPAPPAPPAPKPVSSRAEIGVACPTQVKPEMPRKALQDGSEGVVRAQALIRDGVVREVTILSGPRIFHAAVRAAMLQYKCVSEPGDVLAPQEFVFKVE